MHDVLQPHCCYQGCSRGDRSGEQMLHEREEWRVTPGCSLLTPHAQKRHPLMYDPEHTKFTHRMFYFFPYLWQLKIACDDEAPATVGKRQMRLSVCVCLCCSLASWFCQDYYCWHVEVDAKVVLLLLSWWYINSPLCVSIDGERSTSRCTMR